MTNPLPHAFQLQQTGYWCGPAAVRVGLSCRSVIRTQADLAMTLGTTAAGTDSSADIVRVMNDELGAGTYAARYLPGQSATDAEVAALRAHLVASVDNGFGIVANVAGAIHPLDGGGYSYPGGHYVAVTGYRAGGDEAFVSDIATREYWTTTRALAVWIATRGYSYPAQVTGETDMAGDYGSLGPPPNEPAYAYDHPDVLLADLHSALVSRKTGWGGEGSASAWALFRDLAALNAKLDKVLDALKGGVEVAAEVDLTDAAIARLADAIADEMAADPERDGRDA